jgi:hypothetical protein
MKFNDVMSSSNLFTEIGTVMVMSLVIAFSFALAGCSDSTTGTNDYGNGTNNGSNNGTGEIGSEPTFSNISQIFTTTCAPCHTSNNDSGVRLNSYDNVMNSVGDQYGMLVVQPGDADGSPIVDKIESPNPQFGVRMPQGGTPLSSDRINQIKEWIDEGAENN